ncbi:hypothetical protein, partial [Syntrophorhabdus aromaticivorans]
SPRGCLVNFETLVRPALLKMRGIIALDHPVVEATAVDSIPGRMPMISGGGRRGGSKQGTLYKA